MSTRVVYRALIGGYEELLETPAAADTAIPFICFTDDPSLRSETWQMEVVEPKIPNDPVRSARHLKIAGHPLLDDFEESLWLDNQVELTGHPEQLFSWLRPDDDLAAPLHSFRSSLAGEADAVLDLGKDDPGRVLEQIRHYEQLYPDLLTHNPHWTAILVRRRNDRVADAMDRWWEQVLRYSRRDQLSFIVAVAAAGARLRSIPLGNYESELHAWPRARRAAGAETARSLGKNAASSAMQVGALQNALDQVTEDFADRYHELQQQIRELTDQARELTEQISDRDRRIEQLTAQLASATAAAREHQAELSELRESRAWRLTAPLRQASAAARRLRGTAPESTS